MVAPLNPGPVGDVPFINPFVGLVAMVFVFRNAWFLFLSYFLVDETDLLR
jgi:hypothetical protein